MIVIICLFKNKLNLYFNIKNKIIIDIFLNIKIIMTVKNKNKLNI